MSSRFDKIEGIDNIEKLDNDDDFNEFDDKKQNIIFRSADKDIALKPEKTC
jgi:hypothetical protein